MAKVWQFLPRHILAWLLLETHPGPNGPGYLLRTLKFLFHAIKVRKTVKKKPLFDTHVAGQAKLYVDLCLFSVVRNLATFALTW
jgi:hypothetical protein